MSGARTSGGMASAPVQHVIWAWVAVVSGTPYALGGHTGGMLGADDAAAAARLRDMARATANSAWGHGTRIELRRFVWDGQPG